MTPEIRTLASAELRVETVKDKPVIRGYAAVFNSISADLGGFRETIQPGAFSRALSDATLDVRALINHDKNLVLGRSSAGTVRLNEGARGLYVEIDPPDTSYAKDLLISMERGDISGMSFRFYMSEDRSGQTWQKTDDGVIRTITSIAKIDDISIATYPAYPDAQAAVRSLQDFLKPSFSRRHNAERLLSLIEILSF